MTDLAAALHDLYVSGPPYDGCDHGPDEYGNDWTPRCVEDAARLTASGWTLAPEGTRLEDLIAGLFSDWMDANPDDEDVLKEECAAVLDLVRDAQPAPDPLPPLTCPPDCPRSHEADGSHYDVRKPVPGYDTPAPDPLREALDAADLRCEMCGDPVADCSRPIVDLEVVLALAAAPFTHNGQHRAEVCPECAALAASPDPLPPLTCPPDCPRSHEADGSHYDVRCTCHPPCPIHADPLRAANAVSQGNAIDAPDPLGPDDHGHTGRLWCDPCVGHGVMLEQGIHRCAQPAPDPLRAAALAVVEAWDGKSEQYVSGYDHFLAVGAVMPALRAILAALAGGAS